MPAPRTLADSLLARGEVLRRPCSAALCCPSILLLHVGHLHILLRRCPCSAWILRRHPVAPGSSAGSGVRLGCGQGRLRWLLVVYSHVRLLLHLGPHRGSPRCHGCSGRVLLRFLDLDAARKLRRLRECHLTACAWDAHLSLSSGSRLACTTQDICSLGIRSLHSAVSNVPWAASAAARASSASRRLRASSTTRSSVSLSSASCSCTACPEHSA